MLLMYLFSRPVQWRRGVQYVQVEPTDATPGPREAEQSNHTLPFYI